MIVSWNWLGRYVRLDMPADLLADRLALAGLNHEGTAEVGGDLAIDLEVTSNRPDCLAHLGVAREVAVLFGRTLQIPDPRPPSSGPPVEDRVAVRVEAADLCPRFTARVVTGVKVGPSPWWLRKRLETLGARPVNNVVDVTNYVMFECGQPLHAYDLAGIAGATLIVRRGREGESLAAINGKSYALKADHLVIADADKPVGLAGVMGGLDSEIGPGSTEVLIEAARFDPLAVRKAVRSLNLPSEASRRFERGVDPELADWASRRCAELILEVAGGILAPGVIDVGGPVSERPAVALRHEQIRRVLGIDVDPAEVDRILRALGLEPTGPSSWRAPSWRADLGREIDLIEEVARIYGYEHIPEDRPVPLVSAPRGPRERVDAEIRSALTGLGFDEAVTYSLVADALATPIEPISAEVVPPIRVEHSSRRREAALRRAIAPSLLAARAHNEAHGNADADLFEVAQVYLPRADRDMPDEPTRLALVGGRDFRGMKGAVEALLGRFHLDGRLGARPVGPTPWFAAGRAAELTLDGEPFGFIGEVARDRRDALGLRSACSAAEISVDLIVARADLVPTYKPMPTVPAVARDLSLVVDKGLPWADIARAVREAAGANLEAVEFLDAFDGGNVPEGRQSVHFGMRFRHPERTLAGDEVDAAVRAAVDRCTATLGATLRA